MAKEEDLKAVTDIADDETVYDVADPVTPEGGNVQKRPADNTTKTVKEDTATAGSFVELFEGVDLSEDFKQKAQMVFEAAVNEAANEKTKDISEALETEFNEKLDEAVNEMQESMNDSVTESIDDIVENLDSYLDYIVAEWMEENEIAIESGMKVEMAESMLEGLVSLVSEHNIQIDESTVDVVSDLEGKLTESTQSQNSLMLKNVELSEELSALRADKAFNEICEGLTTSQKERMRILSEKLDNSDVDGFKSDLSTLKESFFKKAGYAVSEEIEEEGEILTESQTNVRYSEYDSVNSIVAAINARAK